MVLNGNILTVTASWFNFTLEKGRAAVNLKTRKTIIVTKREKNNNKKARHKNIQTVGYHLDKVQEQTKPNYDDRSQDGGYLGGEGWVTRRHRRGASGCWSGGVS